MRRSVPASQGQSYVVSRARASQREVRDPSLAESQLLGGVTASRRRRRRRTRRRWCWRKRRGGSSFWSFSFVQVDCESDARIERVLQLPGGAGGVEHGDDGAGESDEADLHAGDSFRWLK